MLSNNPSRWRVAFEIVSTVLMIGSAGVIAWQGRARFYSAPAEAQPSISLQPVPRYAIAIDESSVRGAKSAHVAIIEFADFECSACVAFATDIEPVLLREYVDTGRVIFVFKNSPLPIHPEARQEAKVTWCAAKQGMYWQVHDRFFELYKQSQRIDLQAVARDVGIDLFLYRNCLAGTEADRHVETDRDSGEALHVTATPTFFFGTVAPDGRVRVTDAMRGARSLKAFKEILDRLLSR